MEDYTPEFTPVEYRGGVWLKRDDLYRRAGIRGGKVRACWHLATHGPEPCDGLITASARKSPQAQIVARLAARLGVPARCHMPQGRQTEEMADMEAHGGRLIQWRAGYNNVIIARALADHRAKPRWRYIPFGMEHNEAMGCTRGQVAGLARDIAEGRVPMPRRVVVCIGSGMSAAGILHGLRDHGLDIPVLGVRVGASPMKRLNSWGPFGWQHMIELVDATERVAYHTPVTAEVGGVLLDPHYEAKCAEYLENGDLFWVVGIRHTAETEVSYENR